MSSLQTLTILLAVLFVTSVVSQQQIVSVNEIEDGGTFSVTCDASRFSTATIPSSVTKTMILGIRRRTSQDTSNMLLAQYRAFGTAQPVQNIPLGRQWTITNTGANGGTDNKNTMKIVILVSDAVCADAGVYTCEVTYEDSEQALVLVSRTENVTARAAAQAITLDANIYNAVLGRPNYSEYQEGENITLTCRIDGPQELEMMWKTGTYDTFSGFITSDYPFDNDITTSDPTLISSGACNTYGHMSVLNLRSLSQAVNDQVTYLCVIMENDQFNAVEVARANLTIGITTPNPGPATAGGGGDEDLGMILGIVFGLLALIVIIVLIVYFCWWRRRGKGDKYGDKEMDEPQTDPNFNAPPPVFYSKPSKHKDEKDNAIPAGMTNDAMDTSYDSRDSANRGPPRYANTDPAFEKEHHRGRSNRGYSEEDADRNGGRGRRPPRERDSHDQNGRHNRSRDYDEEEPRRRYSTDDGTDDRHYSVQGIGDASIGTAI